MSDLDQFGGPFNGQSGRVALVDELLKTTSFNAIVETGTYTGSTTEYFLRQTSLPVHNVEIDGDRAQMAAVRLGKFEQARLCCGDSRRFLRRLSEDANFPQDRVFFYLDAHWNADLSLREEVDLITSRWRNSVVMIDDFQVPDDIGYQYDRYTATSSRRLEYLDSQLQSLPVFFPAIPSSQETGHRRGCVVFGTDQETGGLLNGVKCLRRWNRTADGPGKQSNRGAAGMSPSTGELQFPIGGPLTGKSVAATRYLLVKAHVGFGDRLQALSHAIQYAQKYERTLCVDWTDGIWSDGTLDFDTYFDLCGVPMISPRELYRSTSVNIFPLGWANQLERTADSRFLYRPAYHNPVLDTDHPAEILVYGSTGDRTYYRDNLILLRVKKTFRDLIVEELKKYKTYRCVVHLRGTDRRKSASYEDYVTQITNKMAEIPATESFLVVTDSLPLFQQLQAHYPNAVLRTPHLERFDTLQGTHFQSSIPKREYNLQMLIDFFLLVYATDCISDGESCFSIMAQFLHDGDHADILGYDG